MGFVGGQLAAARIQGVEEHLEGCQSCFRLVTQMARTTCSFGGEGEVVRREVAPALGYFADIPRHIDELYLLHRIGEGAMGQVFLAVDMHLDRPVAVKFLGIQTSEAARRRMLVEARAMARVSHPNVVTIYRVGEIAQRPYLVYEFVRGKSLDRVDKPLPWARVREVALALTRGLAAAHRAGVLHRDIKPANAMLCEDGSVKLLDFGLAKLGESDHEYAADLPREHEASAAPSLTHTGALLGTPRYMAPETWTGAPPGERSDLFSLAAVIYELCTGQVALPGQTFEQMRRAALTAPPRLAGRVPGINPQFAAAIDQCLAADPAARAASAQQLSERLVATPRWTGRRRALVTLAAAALVLAGVVAVMSSTRSSERNRSAKPRPSSASAAADASRPKHACSPDDWCWDVVDPIFLASVWASSRNDAWAVGDLGTIRHWDGAAWREVQSDTTASLTGVHGSTDDDVWLTGELGTALHWDGARIRRIPTPTKAELSGVFARAPDDAWAVGPGGLILHWNGSIWTMVPSGVVEDLRLAVARAPNDAWAAGYGPLVLHWDGQRWSTIDTGAHSVRAIAAISADDVWIGGTKGLLRRLVGGRWRDVELPVSPERKRQMEVTSIYASRADDVWLMTFGSFWHWNGSTWSEFPSPTRYPMYGFSGSAPDDIWAVENTQTMVHWDGRSWTLSGKTPPYIEYRGVWAAASDDVWMVGYSREDGWFGGPITGHIRRNDGTGWRVLPAASPNILHAIWGANTDDVWITGDQGTLLHWDGGRLQTVDLGTEVTLHAVRGSGPGDVWIVGDQGAIFHRSSAAWQRVASGTDAALSGVWATDGEAWAVGAGGTLLHFDGTTWRPMPTGTSSDLRAVWGSRRDDVWAVGNSGTMLHWDGATWSPVNSGTLEHLLAISGTGPDDIWAVTYIFENSNSRTLVHWDGRLWTGMERTSRMILHAVWSIAPDDVWAGGNNWIITHYEPKLR